MLARLMGRARQLLIAPDPNPGPIAPTISPPWQEPYWYEPDVTLALRDLLTPGDVFFDVGANIGGVSTIASTLVGPRGNVFAFEGSPRVVPELVSNLTYCRANNVFLLHNVVADSAEIPTPIYYGASNVADSIMGNQARAPDAVVDSITLDYVCQRFSVMPSLVKMDIEGAEYLALLGARSIIENRIPFILEVNPRQSDAAELLLAAGYRAIDLSTYREHTFDGSCKGSLRNVLFTYGAMAEAIPDGSRAVPVTGLPLEHLSVDASGLFCLSSDSLDPGRYFLRANLKDASAIGGDETIGVSVWSGGQQVLLSICALSHFLNNYTSIPFLLKREGQLALRLTHDAAALRRHVSHFEVLALHR